MLYSQNMEYIYAICMITINDDMYDVHCTLHMVQCTLYIIHGTMYIVQCTEYIDQCTLNISLNKVRNTLVSILAKPLLS